MVVKKSIDLFSFLKEFSTLRSKPIRSLDNYGTVFWLSDIRQTNVCEVFSKTWDGEKEHRSGAWVYVQKPQAIPEPKVPSSIEKWLSKGKNEREPLLLDEIIESADGESIIHKVEEFPDVQKEYQDYYQVWNKWHTRDLEIKAVRKIFDVLFNLYQQQKSQGEIYELVAAFGCFAWKSPSYGEVKRHLITAQVSLFFDMDKAAVMVMPHEDGLKLLLEEDMLDPEDRPPGDESKKVQEALQELDEEIWASGSLHVWLKGWMNSLQNANGYDADFLGRPVASNQPSLTFSPALIMRRRSAQGFVRVFAEICSQIETTGHVPEGITNFLGYEKTSDNESHSCNSSNCNCVEQAEELYFPLDANDEQRQIAQVLARNRRVLVQGPPGTGKSQTIANLLCHLLATGKRVLVTSHTGRALEVLKEKLPAAVTPLCVDAIDDNPRSFIRLEESVQAILNKQSRWGIADQQKMCQLSVDLDSYRRQQAKCTGDLRAIRDQDVFVHTALCEKYSGTLEQIILQLQMETAKFGWIDAYEITEETQNLLTNQEMLELLALMREFDSASVEKLSKLEIDPNDFKTPDEVNSLIAKYFECHSRFQEVQKLRSQADYRLFKNYSPEERTAFYDSLKSFTIQERKIFAYPRAWVLPLARTIRNGNKHLAKQLLDQSRQQLNEIEKLTQNIESDTCTGLAGHDLTTVKHGAIKLRDHFISGKGLRQFGLVKYEIIKENEYILQTVRVNDAPCDTVERLNTLIAWIEVQLIFAKIRSNCLVLDINFVDAYQQQIPFALKVTEVEECCRILDELLQHETMIAEFEKRLQIWGRNESIQWYDDRNVVSSFIEILAAILVEEELAAAQNKMNDYINTLKGMRIAAVVQEYVLPIVYAAEKMNALQYEESYKNYIEIWEQRHKMNRMFQLRHLVAAGCSSLPDALAAAVHNPEWDTRLGEFEAAWKWKRMRVWVDRMEDPDAVERLTEDLHRLKKKIHDTLGELAGEKAWEQCVQRIRQNKNQSAALVAWQQTVRSIGRGTGRNAERYRREARGYMEQCRSAIPAWIMPLYRVADTVACNPELFDTVIIDEASQSGPEALFLQYIAKKIVVVGDDKQISPEFVGIDKEQVNLLRNRYLHDIEFNGRIGTESSFFDLAQLRFGQSICLREHFRCMPEIIQFSNSQFYTQNPLIPLKQYGQGRVSPTLMTIRVEDGYQKGSHPRVKNEPEAKVIAAKIKECCNDPCYQDKTIGVISLLGDVQAGIIMRLLQREIGPEEIERRKIICGNAYAFQGDERDVIFLSMVTSPAGDGGYQALTKQSYEQRFNVAASRAKEQLWLIHSVTLNDLNPSCLRHRLLSYMQNPTVQQQTIGDIHIADLRIAAACSYRGNQVVPAPFQSWFEIDVFLRIVERGFRVIPQHVVGLYQIDMIVEGLKGRLAVECDGDHWHGPERYEQDMSRQRQLERSGYRFWRIRSSVYYTSPEKAMEGLWTMLEKHEIKAGVAADERSVGIFSMTSEVSHSEEDSDQAARKSPASLIDPQPIKLDKKAELSAKRVSSSQQKKQKKRKKQKPAQPVLKVPKPVEASPIMSSLFSELRQELPVHEGEAEKLLKYEADIFTEAQAAKYRSKYQQIGQMIKDFAAAGSKEKAIIIIDRLVVMYPQRPAMLEELTAVKNKLQDNVK